MALVEFIILRLKFMENMENSDRMPLEEAQKEAKAIQGMSEIRSFDEGYESPTSEHYEDSSKILDNLKAINPETAQRFIEVAGLGKELRDEFGPRTYRVFDIVQKEIIYSLSGEGRFNKLYYENSEQEKEIALNEILSILENKMRSDERIRHVFSEKGELLDKAMEFVKKHTLSLILGIKL